MCKKQDRAAVEIFLRVMSLPEPLGDARRHDCLAGPGGHHTHRGANGVVPMAKDGFDRFLLVISQIESVAHFPVRLTLWQLRLGQSENPVRNAVDVVDLLLFDNFLSLVKTRTRDVRLTALFGRRFYEFAARTHEKPEL